MKLLTTELKGKLPKLGETENEEDPMVICKFFTPDAQWTWYVIEGEQKATVNDENDYIFFGYVVGLENELGYFALSDLKKVRGGLGLPVERDLYFEPKKLSEIMKKHR